ncbi:MAG: DNA primase [Dehalococcoidia bacterium]|nr:DNA primase [Dehalococcoidia bacterium]|tara:strand:+ start:3280 stop:5079 length:1800 start_codon:yes stop_codon:yes gene_type:complete
MTLSEDIKTRTNILDLVHQYVPDLKQTGRTYKARCPFHQEATPSFVVFPDRQTWRCFGACATGGDVFTFIMKIEGIDFPAALRNLGNQVGIEVIDQKFDNAPKQSQIQLINLQAQRFFREELNSDRGSFARDYLLGRGVSEESTALFGLGYSPVNGNELVQYLENAGFQNELLVNAGLAASSEGAKPRALFRGRLTFPIHNESGGLIGFGARSLDETMPKYLNTPQTQEFDKSGTLYGLDKAKSGINGDGKRVVIVEGYMDVIAAHQAGFRNVVASMGTALTTKQVELALIHADTVILAMDADKAGQTSMYRSLVDLAQQNTVMTNNKQRRKAFMQKSPAFEIFKVARITTGKDPDELIRTEPLLWSKTINEAPSLADFLLMEAPKYLEGLSDFDGDQVISALAQVVFASNWKVQDKYVMQLAQIVGTTPERLESNLAKLTETRVQADYTVKRSTAAASPFKSTVGDPLEEHALAIAAQFPEFWGKIANLEVDRIVNPENRAVLSAFKQNDTIEHALESLNGQAAEQLVTLIELALPEMDLKQRSDAFDSCIKRLEIRFYREIKQQEETLLESIEENDFLSMPNLDANERLKDLYSSGT